MNSVYNMRLRGPRISRDIQHAIEYINLMLEKYNPKIENVDYTC